MVPANHVTIDFVEGGRRSVLNRRRLLLKRPRVAKVGPNSVP